MKIVKWIVVSLVAIGIIYYVVETATKSLPVQMAVAKKGTIFQYVEERAKTSLPHVYHLSMPLAGRIMPIELREGAPVKKGQVIARMDDSDIKTKIAETEAQINAIKAEITINQYHAIENTALKESKDWIATLAALVAASRKKIEANQSVLKFAKDYQQTLDQSGQAISRIKKSEANKDCAVALVDVEIAEISAKAMELLHSIFKLWPVYINEYLTKKNLNKKVLESRLLEVQATLDKARRDLKRLNIVSPVNGVVLKRYFSNERVLPAGSLLVDIGDLTQLEATADILSQEVVTVNVGNDVDIYGPAIGENAAKGKVARIKPEGFTKLSSLGVEQQRVHVVIHFDKDVLMKLKQQGKSLGDGYRVRVKIYTASSSDGVIVPRTALFKGNQGKWQLFKTVDGKAVLTDVKVSLVNDHEVQILEGVEEKDSVVVAPPVSLTTGTRVKAER